jgi:20S proteasome alpha/beta subunit
MSVALGLRSLDGLILAADSQATAHSAGLPMRSQTEKVRRLGSHIVYAAVGDEGLQQRIARALEGKVELLTPRQDRNRLAEAIHAGANELQRKALEGWTKISSTEEPRWGGVFCGWAADGPWMLEIDASGEWQFHDAFAAVGCASALVHLAVMDAEHLRLPQRPLRAAQVIAFSAVQLACQASAAHICEPVQMAVVSEREARVLSTLELAEIGDLAQRRKHVDEAFFDRIRTDADDRQLGLLDAPLRPAAAAS